MTTGPTVTFERGTALYEFPGLTREMRDVLVKHKAIINVEANWNDEEENYELCVSLLLPRDRTELDAHEFSRELWDALPQSENERGLWLGGTIHIIEDDNEAQNVFHDWAVYLRRQNPNLTVQGYVTNPESTLRYEDTNYTIIELLHITHDKRDGVHPGYFGTSYHETRKKLRDLHGDDFSPAPLIE